MSKLPSLVVKANSIIPIIHNNGVIARLYVGGGHVGFICRHVHCRYSHLIRVDMVSGKTLKAGEL